MLLFSSKRAIRLLAPDSYQTSYLNNETIILKLILFMTTLAYPILKVLKSFIPVHFVLAREFIKYHIRNV